MIDLQIANQYLKLNYPTLYLAVNFHKTHKNNAISFLNLPYLIDIYKDTNTKKVLMKSTQSGITEWLIIETIRKAYYQKRNIFYVMPTDKLKNQFVNTRFNQSIQHTEFYQGIFQDSEYDNMSVKQIGEASIFFAVSNSRNNFTSFPADDLIIDELDECNLENIEMATERLAFSEDPQEIRVANPTYPGLGIDYEFEKSDQKNWLIKCDSCSTEFTPDFFKNIVRQEKDDEFFIMDKSFEWEGDKDINLICNNCNKPVYRYKPGIWQATKKSSISGRQLNQLFSSRRHIKDIVTKFNDSLNNDIKMQRFYNGILGLPFLGRGASVTDDIIKNCVREYKMPNSCTEPCILGLDVGKKLTCVIFRITNNTGQYKLQLVYAGELYFVVDHKKIDISELADLMRRYNVVSGIVDAAPEMRLSKLIAQNFSRIWRCNYLHDNYRDQVDHQNKIYKTDRTASMDGVKEQLALQNIYFPKSIYGIEGFIDQLKAPIRIFEKNPDRVDQGKWVWREGYKADHYFHAVNYANIAKKILLQS